MGDTLTKVSSMIGGNADEGILKLIIDMVEAQLLMRINDEEVPYELQYIIVNVSVARYNQIGDEGKSSMTIEGESASWLADLFAPYEKDIRLYLGRKDQTVSGGSIRFL